MFEQRRRRTFEVANAGRTARTRDLSYGAIIANLSAELNVRKVHVEAGGRRAGFVAFLISALATPSCYVILASEPGASVGYVSAYRFPRLDHANDQVYVFAIEVGRRPVVAVSGGACDAAG